MSFTEITIDGSFASLINELDTYLVANAKWTLHDSAAATNEKVYKQENTTTTSEFYLLVKNNFSGFVGFQLYEDWDEVGHTGSGNNTTLGYLTISGTTAIALAVHDDYLMIVNKTDGQAVYFGQMDREDTTKNTPVAIVKTSSSGTTPNPLGGPSTGGTFEALFDENGVMNSVELFGLVIKNVAGAGKVMRTIVKNASTNFLLGTLYNTGCDSIDSTSGHFVNGDIWNDTGVDWLLVGNTGDTYGCCAVKKE